MGETLKAYKGCLLKLRQQQQLYIEEQDDQHLFEVEHGILDILGTDSPNREYRILVEADQATFFFFLQSKKSGFVPS